MADRQYVRRDRQDSRFRIYTYMMVLASLVAISGPKKVSISRARAPPLPMPLVRDLARLKPLRTAPYKQQVQIFNVIRIGRDGLYG
jgi:hypothetical protein